MSIRCVRLPWSAVCRTTLVAVLSLIANARAAGPCGAAGVFSSTSTRATCTYDSPGEDTFVVPAGVSRLSVLAIGAPGGRGGQYPGGSAGAVGGVGAVVSAPAVAFGGVGTLYVEVGGPGGNGVGGTSCAGGGGGINGGGHGGGALCTFGGGGGGGGESDVRSEPALAGGLTGGDGDPRLVVAGGGGGGAGSDNLNATAGGSSGGSDSTGAGAGGGIDCSASTDGAGGTGESGPGGGSAGQVTNPASCGPHALGTGGTAEQGGRGANGANTGGGGGGGGGFTGGGGGASALVLSGIELAPLATGGGGGASFGPAGTSFASAPSSSTTAMVQITWALPGPAVTFTTPMDGASYSSSSPPRAVFTCTARTGRLKSGLAGCSASVDGGPALASGSPLPGVVGPHTLIATATDTAGRVGTATVHYTITAVRRPPPGVAVLSSLRVAPREFSLSGRRVNGRCLKLTGRNQSHRRCRRAIKLTISYTLNHRANVTFTLKRQAAGRLVDHRCVKPTPRNRKHGKCTRLADLSGAFVHAGETGLNRFSWLGRLRRRQLPSGTYLLTATPTGGRPEKVAFTIAR